MGRYVICYVAVFEESRRAFQKRDISLHQYHFDRWIDIFSFISVSQQAIYMHVYMLLCMHVGAYKIFNSRFFVTKTFGETF